MKFSTKFDSDSKDRRERKDLTTSSYNAIKSASLENRLSKMTEEQRELYSIAMIEENILKNLGRNNTAYTLI